jgi:plasmid stabilization system protein ParE
MTYRVVLTPTAREKIFQQARYLAVEQQTPGTAARWLKRILTASETLTTMPRRCPMAPESIYRPYEIRWLGIGDFMLIFTIREESKTVWVLTARSSRQLPKPQDLPEQESRDDD